MRNLLATLVATITRQPRYFPDFEWSKKLWTHNVFRFLGMLFGEHYGIRPSVTSWNDTEGNQYQVAFTLEAQLALFEIAIRSFFKRHFAYKVVVLPQLQLADVAQGSFIPYRFAIALDSYNDNAGTNSGTMSHTSTGSNLLLIVAVLGDINASDNLSGVTYNSIALGKAQNIRFPSDRWLDLWSLPGTSTSGSVSTGANNVVATGNSFNNVIASSYTGCNQSGQPDGSNSATSSGTTMSISVTITASNCWLASVFYSGGGSFTASTNTTKRSSATTFSSAGGFGDSNGTMSTGSQTASWTQTTGTYAIAGMSFAPVVVITNTDEAFRARLVLPLFYNQPTGVQIVK